MMRAVAILLGCLVGCGGGGNKTKAESCTTNGVERCTSGNVQETCSGGAWSVKNTCATGSSCIMVTSSVSACASGGALGGACDSLPATPTPECQQGLVCAVDIGSTVAGNSCMQTCQTITDCPSGRYCDESPIASLPNVKVCQPLVESGGQCLSTDACAVSIDACVPVFEAQFGGSLVKINACASLCHEADVNRGQGICGQGSTCLPNPAGAPAFQVDGNGNMVSCSSDSNCHTDQGLHCRVVQEEGGKFCVTSTGVCETAVPLVNLATWDSTVEGIPTGQACNVFQGRYCGLTGANSPGHSESSYTANVACLIQDDESGDGVCVATCTTRDGTELACGNGYTCTTVPLEQGFGVFSEQELEVGPTDCVIDSDCDHNNGFYCYERGPEKFQCAKNIICTGASDTTSCNQSGQGTGYTCLTLVSGTHICARPPKYCQ